MNQLLFRFHIRPVHFAYLAAVLPLLSISGISQIGEVEIGPYMLILSNCILLFLTFFFQKLKIDRFLGLIFTFNFVLMCVTLYQSGFEHIGLLFNAVSVVLLVNCMRKDAKTVVESLSILAFFLIVATLISVMIGANEDGKYFIGGKNRLSIILIPLAFVFCLNDLLHLDRIRPISVGLFLLSALSCYLGGSGTGVFVSVVSLVLLSAYHMKKPKKGILIFTMLIVFLFPVFNEVFISTQLWKDFTSLLEKSTSLTGRTEVWSLAFDSFKKHPVFGVGSGVEMTFLDRYKLEYTVTEGHNFFVEILYTTGVVGLVLYLLYFAQGFKKAVTETSRVADLLFVWLLAVLVNGVSESVSTQTMTILLLALPKYLCIPENAQKNEKTLAKD